MFRKTVLMAVGVGFVAGTAHAGLTVGQLFGVNSGTGGQFLVTIDKTDGSITTIGNTPFTIDGLAFSPTNVLFAADNDLGRLVTLNPFTGAVDSVIGNSWGMSLTIEGLTFRPTDGTLWGAEVLTDTLVSINPTNGELTTIGSFGGPDGIAGLSWSADGSTLFGMDHATGGFYEIDPESGHADIIGFGGGGNNGGPLGLATDPTDGTLFTAEWREGADMTLATVSPTNGFRTFVGTMVGAPQIEGLTFVVPGPCLVGDDGFEPNNSCPAAAALPIGTFINLVVKDVDPDWYEITLGTLSNVTVDVSFIHSFGDVDLELYDACGGNIVAFSTSNTDNESLAFTNFAATANFFLRVFLDGDVCNRYDMTASVILLHDLCSGAPLQLAGSTNFSNVGAFTDGPSEPASCNFGGDSQIQSDVWYRYFAQCTGTATVSLCGSTYDTKLAVYGANCPTVSGTVISCNNDSCGQQSEVSFPVTVNTFYRIRIGGHQGAQGQGTLTVTCVPDVLTGACCFLGGSCLDGQTEVDCLAAGGTYQGDGTDCAGVFCRQCQDNADCDDGDACNGVETCVGGICQPGTPLDCDDGDPCTADSCDPATGCVNTPITPCCGNGVPEAGEDCSNCPLDIPCPAGTTCIGGTCICSEDINADGTINVLDLIELIMSFGPCEDCPADINDDGIVNVLDLIALIMNFGPCPGTPCVWDVNGDGVVDQTDVQAVTSNLGPCDGCPEDVNGDGVVNGQDVAAVATHFGPCP